jgi:integrase
LIQSAKQAERAQRDTLRAICEKYQEDEGSELRSFKLRQSILDRLIYPELGSSPITAIKRSDIVRLLDGVKRKQGPQAAHAVLKLLRKIMNWHATRADDFHSPIVKGMVKVNNEARERILTDDEIRAIWRATENGVEGAFVRFLLLTGARRTEAAKAEWTEIADGVWTLPASRNKTGVDLARPLSKAALAVLPARSGRWLFTLTGAAAISSFNRLKSDLDRASGVTGYTLHDLRRTSRSLMSRAGVNSDHAERCLGHVIGGVRGVYDRHAYQQEMARAYEMLATLVARVVEGPSANVVALSR